jgi:alginate O-acetyltransferase complex protein AlgI
VNVPSWEFLGFAALIALTINISAAPAWRRAVLLLANVAFVLTFTRDPKALAPFVAFLFAGYVAMKFVETRKNRTAFAIVVGAFVLAFVWLKRYSFVPVGSFLPFSYLTVGLSYAFFRVLSLVIDAYQNALPAPIGPVTYVNYTLNFTSFVSGPIQTIRDYRESESERPAVLDASVGWLAIERITLGFFKVSVLSPLAAAAQAHCVATALAGSGPAQHVVFASLAIALFPLYLYVNFSGYMDVVIGVARFLRLDLPENFVKPFSARGFIEFWSRWHVTLSNWLKTYVFSPLLIASMRNVRSPRLEPLLGVGAFFVTFFLVGVWHGQTSEFIFYGVLQGLGVSGNKLYQIEMMRRLGRPRYRALCAQPVYAAVSRGLTIGYFSLTLLWFWGTWPQLAHAALSLGAGGVLMTMLLVVAGFTAALWSFSRLRDVLRPRVASRGLSWAAPAYARVAWSSALMAVTVSVTAVLDAPAPHIIYKAF